MIVAEDLLRDYRSPILQCMTNLEPEFIVKNYDKIFKLLKNLDNQKYEAEYRKVICLMDQYHYSHFN